MGIKAEMEKLQKARDEAARKASESFWTKKEQERLTTLTILETAIKPFIDHLNHTGIIKKVKEFEDVVGKPSHEVKLLELLIDGNVQPVSKFTEPYGVNYPARWLEDMRTETWMPNEDGQGQGLIRRSQGAIKAVGLGFHWISMPEETSMGGSRKIEIYSVEEGGQYRIQLRAENDYPLHRYKKTVYTIAQSFDEVIAKLYLDSR